MLSFSLLAFSSEAEIIGRLLQDEDTYVNTTAGSVGGLIGLVQSSTVLDRVPREGVECGQNSATKDKRFGNKMIVVIIIGSYT